MGETGNLSFEQALERLEAIVEKLDSGEMPLEESIKLFEEGMTLKTLCEQQLKEAEAIVEQYVADEAAPEEEEG